MKKRLSFSIFLFFISLLTACAYAPELYSYEYLDYELTNESAVIDQEESVKYIKISGTLKNTGNGIIDFKDSSLYYIFEHKYYNIIPQYKHDGVLIDGILPNEVFNFEKSCIYEGNASLGAVANISRELIIKGFQSSDIIKTIEISNQSITSTYYNGDGKYTTFTYSFDWKNSGEVAAQTVFISFSINENHCVYYGWKPFNKKTTGHSDLKIFIDGNFSSEELENIDLTFISRSPGYTREHDSVSAVLLFVLIYISLSFLITPIILIISAIRKKYAIIDYMKRQ